MRRELTEVGVPGSVLLLRADQNGLVVGDGARLPVIEDDEESWGLEALDNDSQNRGVRPTALFDFEEQ
jgi:hypothetical protein